MQMPGEFSRQVLQEEFEKRRRINPSFSLRAFARFLGMAPGTLSGILSRKIPLTRKMGAKVARRLGWEGALADGFVNAAKQPKSLRHARLRPFGKNELRELRMSQMERRIVRDWYHFAILEMTVDPRFTDCPRAISARLGITERQGREALEALRESGMLVRSGDGRWVKDVAYRRTSNVLVTNPDLKLKQKEIRQKAIEAVDEQDIRRRSMTSVTFCIDPARIDEARERIRAFNQEMGRFFEGGERSEVYAMEVSLFSLEKQEKSV